MKNVLHHPKQFFGSKIIIFNHLSMVMGRSFRNYAGQPVSYKKIAQTAAPFCLFIRLATFKENPNKLLRSQLLHLLIAHEEQPVVAAVRSKVWGLTRCSENLQTSKPIYLKDFCP